MVQERAGPAAARGKDFWKVPTGLVDAGEDIAVAAEREVRGPVLAALLLWCGWFLASDSDGEVAPTCFHCVQTAGRYLRRQESGSDLRA